MRKRLFAIAMAIIMVVSMAPVSLANNDAQPQQNPAGGDTAHWASDSTARCEEMGILEGMTKPADDLDYYLPRGEMFRLMDNAMQYRKTAQNSFSDLEDSYAHYDAVLRLTQAGVVKGYADGTLQADSPISRAEAVVLFARMFMVPVNADAAEDFADADAIGWAKPEVGGMKAAGYIQGWEGSFHPRDNITLGEVTQILSNMLDALISAEGTYTEDVEGKGFSVINKAEVKAEGADFGGNLMIAPGVGEGSVTLKDVAVGESLYILGGGANSIVIEGSFTAKAIYIYKDGDDIRLVNNGEKALPDIYILDGSANVILSGKFGTVNIGDGVKVTLAGNSAVDTVNMSCEGSVLEVESGSKVNEVIIAGDDNIVEGGGSAELVRVEKGDDNIVNVPGAKVEVSEEAGDVTAGNTTIEPGKTEDVPLSSTPGGGGGGGGGGGSGGGTSLTAVTITPVTTQDITERTYTESEFAVDLSELFSFSANADKAVYKIAEESTGSGEIDGTNLKNLTAAGTFVIQADVAATATHAAATGKNTLTVLKAAGAAVAAVSVIQEKTHESVTIAAVSPPDSGQAVEYAIVHSSDFAAPIVWQTGLEFTGLTPDTFYLILARAQENDLYNAGDIIAYSVTTNPASAILIGTTTNGDRTIDIKNKNNAKYIADLEDEFEVYLNETWVADETCILADYENPALAIGDFYISATDYNLYRASEAVAANALYYAYQQCMNGNGVKVEYFDSDDNGRIDKIYYTVYTVAKVASKGSDYVFFTTAANDWLNFTDSTGKWDAANVIGFDDISEGDVVTGVQINGKLYVSVCTTDEGKITVINSAHKSYVINDTTYKVAKFPYSGAAVSITQLALGNELTVYLDEYGYIVNTGPATIDPNSIYYVKGNNSGSTIGGATAKLYGMDGVTRIVNVDKYYDYAAGALTDVTYGAPAANGLQYQVFRGSEDNGNWTLDELPGFAAGQSFIAETGTKWKVSRDLNQIQVSADGVTWSKEGTLFANDNTVFVDVTNGRVYESYISLPESLSFTSGAYVVSTANDRLLTVVFMDGTVVDDDATRFFIYQTESVDSYQNSKGENVYVWNTVIDGEITTIEVNSTVNTQIENDGTGLYTVSATSGGAVSALNDGAFIALSGTSGDYVETNAGSVLIVGTTAWEVTSSTVFVLIDTVPRNNTAEIVTQDAAIAGSETVNGSRVIVQAKGVTGADAATAKVVYIWE